MGTLRLLVAFLASTLAYDTSIKASSPRHDPLNELQKSFVLENIHLIHSSGPFDHGLQDLKSSHCHGKGLRLAVLLPQTEESQSFQMLTTMRFYKDFDLLYYDRFEFIRSSKQLKFENVANAGSSMKFEMIPGPITKLKMINDVTSPFPNILTYVQEKVESFSKGIALIVNCDPVTKIPTNLIDQFSMTYFEGEPFEDNIIEEDYKSSLDQTKFISAGWFDREVFIRNAEFNFKPGAAYIATLFGTSIENDLFKPFIGVEFPSHNESARYPIAMSNGQLQFKFVSPFWEPSHLEHDRTLGFVKIFHDRRSTYEISFQNCWDLTIFILARRSINILAWSTLLFLIPKENVPLLDPVIILGLILRLAFIAGSHSIIDASILAILSWAFALSSLTLVRLSLIWKRRMDPLKVQTFGLAASKIVPLLIIGPLIYFKLWNLIPFTIGMQLLFVKTVFGKDSLRQQSSILLQLIAASAYLAPQIPQIQLAVETNNVLLFKMDFSILLLWALIIWTILIGSHGSKMAVKLQHAKLLIQYMLILWFLPELKLLHIWRAFIFNLTLNFAFSKVNLFI